MNGKALGIIETVGLVPAVEAGDVAVKTAAVSLIGSQAVGGGLVSILMTGDVSAVKASVDAGSSAAARLGEVFSVTVIARTADGLGGILMEESKSIKRFPGGTAQGATHKESVSGPEALTEPASAEAHEAQIGEMAEVEKKSAEAGDGEPLSLDMADLNKLKVTKLRRLARQIPGFSIARGEIKYAKRKDLLEAFTAYIKSLT
ncbi:hypothetical protein DSLASN_12100 [Desulfoluna limicola]|uniref:BMC domain-containing protein n=1 Tax=Desulfoluna limicola TaxID=2810562 RepID=A0ABM7PEC3_9BACT|nr:BMC domain-containing protein [Desulfoluna limicola]BCS95578.1 hypothetical protein DSLASN_12100 [Desulfoluna limicola]